MPIYDAARWRRWRVPQGIGWAVCEAASLHGDAMRALSRGERRRAMRLIAKERARARWSRYLLRCGGLSV